MQQVNIEGYLEAVTGDKKKMYSVGVRLSNQLCSVFAACVKAAVFQCAHAHF